jgi:ribosomal protein S12 methylthiotransferase accessory factor YcaO
VRLGRTVGVRGVASAVRPIPAPAEPHSVHGMKSVSPRARASVLGIGALPAAAVIDLALLRVDGDGVPLPVADVPAVGVAAVLWSAGRRPRRLTLAGAYGCALRFAAAHTSVAEACDRRLYSSGSA